MAKIPSKTAKKKVMTKNQIAAEIAEKNEISKKTAVAILEQIAELAYKQTKSNASGNVFVFPGIGKLVMVQRAARIGHHPQTKEKMKFPAKKVLKFRVSKLAKDAVLETK